MNTYRYPIWPGAVSAAAAAFLFSLAGSGKLSVGEAVGFSATIALVLGVFPFLTEIKWRIRHLQEQENQLTSSSKSREFHSAHGPSRIFRSSGGMAKLVRASSRRGQEGKTT